jgi:hypothetical protein
MRLLLKSLAACTGAAAVVAIAGCGPASINDASPAANASGLTAASSSPAAAPATAGATEAPDAGAASSAAASQAPAAAAATTQIPTALSIAMTLPVHHPLQTTAIIVGRLSEPDNGGAPLPGRLVWLQRLGTGGWLLFRTAVTGPDGRVAFQVHVVVGAAFRLVYAGTPNLARAVTPVRIVTA